MRQAFIHDRSWATVVVDAPIRHTTGASLPLVPGTMRRKADSREGGFTLVEVLLVLAVLGIVGSMFFAMLMDVTLVTGRESAKVVVTASARGAMEIATKTIRNELMQFNTVPGTPLGVNFDLDDPSGPLIRDAILFYVDQNQSAMLYPAGANSGPYNAGLDDRNGDGFADVVGIGLRAEDDNGDGVQDFVDLDGDGKPDDLDNDGNPDKLWELVLARFDKVADVGNAAFWKSALVLAHNVYIRRLNPAGPLQASNIDTFQFMAKSPSALLSDTNGDGVLDETEIGSLVTKDKTINDLQEIAAIDAVILSLHSVDLAQTLPRKVVVQENISSHIITPRAFALYRRNGIVGFADPADPKHIN